MKKEDKERVVADLTERVVLQCELIDQLHDLGLLGHRNVLAMFIGFVSEDVGSASFPSEFGFARFSSIHIAE